MGVYVNSVGEVKDAIIAALDNIEGDFDSKTLLQALKKCESYPHTSDYRTLKYRTRRKVRCACEVYGRTVKALGKYTLLTIRVNKKCPYHGKFNAADHTGVVKAISEVLTDALKKK